MVFGRGKKSGSNRKDGKAASNPSEAGTDAGDNTPGDYQEDVMGHSVNDVSGTGAELGNEASGLDEGGGYQPETEINSPEVEQATQEFKKKLKFFPMKFRRHQKGDSNAGTDPDNEPQEPQEQETREVDYLEAEYGDPEPQPEKGVDEQPAEDSLGEGEHGDGFQDENGENEMGANQNGVDDKTGDQTLNSEQGQNANVGTDQKANSTSTGVTESNGAPPKDAVNLNAGEIASAAYGQRQQGTYQPNQSASSAALYYSGIPGGYNQGGPDVAGPPADPYQAYKSEPQYNPYAAPNANPYATPNANPYAAPNANPFAAPNANPFAAPTANPFAAPTANPFAAPTANPYAAPNANPFAAPNANYSAGVQQFGAPPPAYSSSSAYGSMNPGVLRPESAPSAPNTDVSNLEKGRKLMSDGLRQDEFKEHQKAYNTYLEAIDAMMAGINTLKAADSTASNKIELQTAQKHVMLLLDRCEVLLKSGKAKRRSEQSASVEVESLHMPSVPSYQPDHDSAPALKDIVSNDVSGKSDESDLGGYSQYFPQVPGVPKKASAKRVMNPDGTLSGTTSVPPDYGSYASKSLSKSGPESLAQQGATGGPVVSQAGPGGVPSELPNFNSQMPKSRDNLPPMDQNMPFSPVRSGPGRPQAYEPAVPQEQIGSPTVPDGASGNAAPQLGYNLPMPKSRDKFPPMSENAPFSPGRAGQGQPQGYDAGARSPLVSSPAAPNGVENQPSLTYDGPQDQEGYSVVGDKSGSVRWKPGMRCGVCMSEKVTTILPCGHTYCDNCVENIFEIFEQCAMCNRPIARPEAQAIAF